MLVDVENGERNESGRFVLDRGNMEEHVLKALRPRYKNVVVVPFGPDAGATLRELKALKPRIVFNLTEWIDGDRIASLEPDLAGRFRRALFFADEAHLEPRKALASLAAGLEARGIAIRFGVDGKPTETGARFVVDCRGLAARDALPELRGVRGEMLVVRTRDVSLSRPVRLLHPRIPLYIVPRGDGVFMIGATMIESEERRSVSVRSAMELLNAAYTLHPAFGEAEIVELGADLRPTFPDNLPCIRRNGRVLHANGLFRHGFLLAPWLARQVADAVLLETSDADIPERRHA